MFLKGYFLRQLLKKMAEKSQQYPDIQIKLHHGSTNHLNAAMNTASLLFSCYICTPVKIILFLVMLPLVYFHSCAYKKINRVLDRWPGKITRKDEATCRLKWLWYAGATFRAASYIIFLLLLYTAFHLRDQFFKDQQRDPLKPENYSIITFFIHALSESHGIGIAIIPTVITYFFSDVFTFFKFLSRNYTIATQRSQLNAIFGEKYTEIKYVDEAQSLYYFLVHANLLTAGNVAQEDHLIAEISTLLRKHGIKNNKPSSNYLAVEPFTLNDPTLKKIKRSLSAMYDKFQLIGKFKEAYAAFCGSISCINSTLSLQVKLKSALQDEIDIKTEVPSTTAVFTYGLTDRQKILEVFSRLFQEGWVLGGEDRANQSGVIYIPVTTRFPAENAIKTVLESLNYSTRQPPAELLSANTTRTCNTTENETPSKAKNTHVPKVPQEKSSLFRYFIPRVTTPSSLPTEIRFRNGLVYPPPTNQTPIYLLRIPSGYVKKPYADINGPLHFIFFAILTAAFDKKHEDYKQTHERCLETGRVVFVRDPQSNTSKFKTHPLGHGVGDGRVFATKKTVAKVGEQEVTLYDFDKFVPHAH